MHSCINGVIVFGPERYSSNFFASFPFRARPSLIILDMLTILSLKQDSSFFSGSALSIYQNITKPSQLLKPIRFSKERYLRESLSPAEYSKKPAPHPSSYFSRKPLSIIEYTIYPKNQIYNTYPFGEVS